VGEPRRVTAARPARRSRASPCSRVTTGSDAVSPDRFGAMVRGYTPLVRGVGEPRGTTPRLLRLRRSVRGSPAPVFHPERLPTSRRGPLARCDHGSGPHGPIRACPGRRCRPCRGGHCRRRHRHCPWWEEAAVRAVA